jgi:hypothetical protein
MTLLCEQCINCIYQVGVTGERWQRGSIVGPSQLADVVLLRVHTEELLPCEVVFQVTPHPLDRVQLWTVGWYEHEAHGRGEGEPLCGMRPPVVQEQEVPAVWDSFRQGVDEELAALGVAIRQFEDAPLARRGGHGAIDVEPLADLLHRADGLHAAGGEAPSADGQHAKTAVVLTDHADRAGIPRRDDPLQPRATGNLKLPEGVSVCWCGWGAGS